MSTAVELIQKKRDGKELAAGEIDWLLSGYTGGSVTEYQMAAMAMAVFHNGLGPAELTAWTNAMLHSGEVLDLSHIPGPIVDKHSTGGVGDKVSIPLTPMVTACGVWVPMISGRGLGHTGGTLDKLESIPGLRTQLSTREFSEVLEKCGLVMGGQSKTLVPADRKLYALRDATGTVESIPLIASSIMSKKMAEDLDGLVLDVKYGVGAFMTDQQRARQLAQTMVEIGANHGVTTVALLTQMNTPLGFEVGNANEVKESIEVLRGGGPADLVELTLAIGAEMLMIAGVEADEESARARLEWTRSSGRALEVFATVIGAQGGDPGVLDDPSRLPSADQTHEITADRSGFVTVCDAYKVGVAAMRLGAGRERKEDTIDPGVGITVLAKPGTEVAKGEPLARLRYRHTARLEESLRVLDGAWHIADEGVPTEPLIAERIGP